MILKIRPDTQKSKSLVEMARITLQRLNEINLYKYPTNTLTDYYDVIHKLMEALSLNEGIKIKGEGAHQELIDYIFKKYQLNESDRIFIQEIRDFRNRISYEGFMISEDYIKTNLEKINRIVKTLEQIYSR